MIKVLVLGYRLERAYGCGVPSCCWSWSFHAWIALAVRNLGKGQEGLVERWLMEKIWKRCSSIPFSSGLFRWACPAWIRHQVSWNSPKGLTYRWCCSDAPRHAVRPLNPSSCLVSHRIPSFGLWTVLARTIRKFQAILHFHLAVEYLFSGKVDQSEAPFRLSTVKRRTRLLRKNERIGLTIALYPFWRCEKFTIAHFICYSQSLSFSQIRSFPIALFWHLKSLIQRLVPLLDEETSLISKEKY